MLICESNEKKPTKKKQIIVFFSVCFQSKKGVVSRGNPKQVGDVSARGHHIWREVFALTL